ncbi:MAG TPA: type II toxin-antitoxin system prevent-host-death family antitoxin, partial [Chitinophagaceae bacterium]|nr:type II toxin-antitoxin system prevent-host-death family antitoxin [Chitinophagaceae bacterium]
MQVLNYSDFRNNLAQTLNSVNNDKEIVVVSRTKGKNVVVMDLEEYNSIQETLHLTSSAASRQRLTEAVLEMNAGKFKAHRLIQFKSGVSVLIAPSSRLTGNRYRNTLFL